MPRLARILVWVLMTPWLAATAPCASAQLAPWTWGWGPSAPAGQAFTPEAFADYLGSGQPPHPAVVRIIAPENGGTSMGSGVLVDINASQGLVLTNWHVIRGATGAVLVQFPDGFQTAGTVIRHDEPWDLAAVAIWRPRVVPIPIAPHPPTIGEPLSIAGYGKGPFRSEAGPCTQYLAPGSGYPLEFVELQATARRGDSGGPILNARGELAGILFGQAQGRTIGACSTRVQTFLASVGSRGITPDIAASLQAAVAAERPAGGGTGQASALVTTAPSPSPPGPGDSGAIDPMKTAAVPTNIVRVGSQDHSPSAPLPPTSEAPGPPSPAAGFDAAPTPVPAAMSTATLPASIAPPPPAWGTLPEGRPVGRSVDELLDIRTNGRAIVVAAGGAVLTLVGLKTVLGGRRPGRRRRRPPEAWDADDD